MDIESSHRGNKDNPANLASFFDLKRTNFVFWQTNKLIFQILVARINICESWKFWQTQIWFS